jgi:hypothetical protein
MLWSVLPWMNKDGMQRHPRRSVATAVRLLLFGVGCCIAYAVCQVYLLPDLYYPTQVWSVCPDGLPMGECLWQFKSVMLSGTALGAGV